MTRSRLPFRNWSWDQLVLILGPMVVSAVLVILYVMDYLPLGLTGLLVLVAALNVGGDLMYALRDQRAVRDRRVPLHNDMTGRDAMVETDFKQGRDGYRGSVRLGSELWRAVCDRPVPPGARVRVTGRRGLVLEVVPDPRGRRE